MDNVSSRMEPIADALWEALCEATSNTRRRLGDAAAVYISQNDPQGNLLGLLETMVDQAKEIEAPSRYVEPT